MGVATFSSTLIWDIFQHFLQHKYGSSFSFQSTSACSNANIITTQDSLMHYLHITVLFGSVSFEMEGVEMEKEYCTRFMKILGGHLLFIYYEHIH